MSHVQLTAKYRPQTFAQVAGQEQIRAILSRAAAQDRVAAAYLFSGTRGVGKTTLARIFAKALNCETAPTAEPCNACRHCRQITAGSAPDVAEIDGASNRGIEQARRLKEDVGYAPLDCRYKVIIIDEAHMLTKEAFNALLKTMEEPPPRVTFIMATTEPHKFPATIISRSQHYVFTMLPQAGLQAHLERILELEGREYEPAATALLARRASGSVRDGMSLLEQVLTISEQTLSLEDVRKILGLAGSELFLRLVGAMRQQDCVAVHDVLRDLLRQGLDLGFFLRELAGLWRNFFLLRQAGEKAFPLLELPEEEAKRWQSIAAELSTTYIHAAWQITLESQRKVLTSLEPAQALEMLLLNLTFLPQLVPLEDAFTAKSGQPGPISPGESHRPGPGSAASTHGPSPERSSSQRSSQPPSQQARISPAHAAPEKMPPSPATKPSSDALSSDFSETRATPTAPVQTESGPAPNVEPCTHRGQGPEQENRHETSYPQPGPSSILDRNAHEPRLQSGMPTVGDSSAPGRPQPTMPLKTWEGFLEHYDWLCRSDLACFPGLRQVECTMTEHGLTLHCRHLVQYDRLSDPSKHLALERLAQEYFNRPLQVRIVAPQNGAEFQHAQPDSSPDDEHPLVREFVELFNAKVVSVEPRQAQSPLIQFNTPLTPSALAD